MTDKPVHLVCTVGKEVRAASSFASFAATTRVRSWQPARFEDDARHWQMVAASKWSKYNRNIQCLSRWRRVSGQNTTSITETYSVCRSNCARVSGAACDPDSDASPSSAEQRATESTPVAGMDPVARCSAGMSPDPSTHPSIHPCEHQLDIGREGGWAGPPLQPGASSWARPSLAPRDGRESLRERAGEREMERERERERERESRPRCVCALSPPRRGEGGLCS